MSLETNSFEFDEFLLNGKEKVLLRDGKPLQITPKAFQLLQILVENHGHLVERDKLLNAVWEDSFVEEGNLTFTIRLLRKILGDSKQNPRFIETVSKRGYRFIAKVKEVFDAAETPNKIESEASQKQITAPNIWTIRQKIFVTAVALTFLLTATIGISSWYARSKIFEANDPILFAPFALEKISTNGKVQHAILSPNGKNVIYTNSGVNEKQSVWLRQLDSGNNVEIITASDGNYFGLALSPDGNFLYFVRSRKANEKPFDLYRVSIFGGIPQKILDDTEGWVSISPDGAMISFVRCPYRDDDYCSLWTADAINGKNEKKLVAHTRPTRIGDNEFSPDGTKIAFAAGQSLNKSNEFGLKEIDIETLEQKDLTAEKFFNIHSLAWLPDHNGLLITAAKVQTKHSRIWHISAENGNAAPLTKDSESYTRLSLDKEAKILVSTQIKQDFKLTVLNTENFSNQRVLADASQVSFALDGKIVFSSLMSGNDEIWSINADGSGLKQLTNDAADDTTPIVSNDNKTIFFLSNRTGDMQIWRMNADGSNQTQITDKNGGSPLYVTADGSRIYYLHGIDRTLWHVEVKNGEEQILLNQRSSSFAFSPDGSQFSLLKDKKIEVYSTAEAKIVKTFPLPDETFGSNDVRWTADGKEILYISLETNGNHTLRRQPLNGETPEKVADLGIDEINSFAAAHDGKTFAVVKGGWRHDAVLLKGLK